MAAARQVVPGLFVIPTGVVNTFLLDAADGCALIDAGLPDRVDDILRGIAVVGRRPADVEAGRYKAKPSRVFRFEDIREAHRVMESNEAKGKMVVVL
jgi:hypothetical protein